MPANWRSAAKRYWYMHPVVTWLGGYIPWVRGMQSRAAVRTNWKEAPYSMQWWTERLRGGPDPEGATQRHSEELKED